LSRLFQQPANAEGSIELVGVEPGRYTGVVRAAGFGDAVAATLDIRSGSRVETRAVVMLHGDAPRGRVMDASGRGVGSARVCIAPPVPRPGPAAPDPGFRPNQVGAGPACVVSGVGGALELPRIPYGTYRVSVDAAGYGRIQGEPLEFRAGQEPHAWVLTPAGTVTGRVIDARGAGVAAAQVILRDRLRGFIFETATDESGGFRTDETAAGLWRIEVVPAEHLPIVRDAVAVIAGEIRDLGELRARAAGSVTGRLVGPGGAPVEGAEILAVVSGGPRRPIRETTSGDGGAFRLAGIASGTVLDLQVRPPAPWAAQTVRNVRVPSAAQEVRLDRNVVVRGAARTEAGEVPAKAYVSVFPRPGHPSFEANSGLAASAAVDASTGAFRVENVPPGGEVEVRVVSSGLPDGMQRVDLSAGADPDPVEIVMPRAAPPRRGRVVDSAGRPVAGASVGRAVSSADGAFAVDGLGSASAGRVVVTHPSFAPQPVDVVRLDEGAETIVTLGSGGTLEGTVSDAEGRPLAGVRVAADWPGVSAVSGVGGRYRLERVPPGSAMVRRESLGVPGDADAARVDVEAGGTRRLDFRLRDLAVRGTVRRSGQPLEAAEVTAVQPPEGAAGKPNRLRTRAAATDEEGGFTLVGLEPGAARVTIQSGAFETSLLVEVPENGVDGLELDLPSGVLEGVVLDASGQPSTGACVAVSLDGLVPPELEPPAIGSPSAWSRATSGRDGRFRLVVQEPAPRSVQVCTCAAGCREVNVESQGEGEPVTLWLDGR
jgi:hypothetical protein